MASSWVMEGGECLKEMPPLKMAILLIYEMSSVLGIKPQVYSLHDERTLWVLFPEGCIECDALFEEYGVIIASISKHYPLTVHGMIDELEEGEIEARVDTKGIACTKSNFTGQDFNMLTSVYLTLQFDHVKEMVFMEEVLRQIDSSKKCLAIRSKWQDEAFASALIIPNLLTYYSYIEMSELDNIEINLLESLTIDQMIALWTVFLKESITSGEFEYLYDQLLQDKNCHMNYWELALRLTLTKLNIKVDYANNAFKVEDQEGHRMRFDFSSSSAAEKLFLKILFPSS